jgi:hypothetical protein
MEQHDGETVNPGETVLLKAGFVSRTPTKLIVSGSAVWLGGLHFSAGLLEVRGMPDVVVPSNWRDESPMGSALTYELTARGLQLRAPPGKAQPVQPAGLPVQIRPSECRPI